MEETTYLVHTPLCRAHQYILDQPITLALLADLHNKPYQSIIQSLETHQPDLIAIPGDLVSGGAPKNGLTKVESAKNVLPFLEACTRIAPTYLSLGNHEWMFTAKDLALIQATGTVLLDNDWVKRGPLYIGGLTSGLVTDYWKAIHFMTPTQASWHRLEKRMTNVMAEKLEPDYSWIRTFEKQPGFKILLSHHPEYWAKYLKDFDLDLVLSGHAHGGQVRYYYKGQWHGLVASGQGFLPKYTEGMFQSGHGNLIISRGLANTGGPLPRLFNPREIVYIRII